MTQRVLAAAVLAPGVPESPEAQLASAWSNQERDDGRAGFVPSSPSEPAVETEDNGRPPVRRDSKTTGEEEELHTFFRSTQTSNRSSSYRPSTPTFQGPTTPQAWSKGKTSFVMRGVNSLTRRRRNPSSVRRMLLPGISRRVPAEDGQGPRWRPKVRRLVEHNAFQMFVTTVIMVNAMYIGFETEYKNQISYSLRISLECLFAVIFFVEIILRLSLGIRDFFVGPFTDVGWNVFDLLLVTFSFVDLVIINIFFGDSASEDLEAFAVMRTLRLLRIARLFKLLQFFRELWLLVSGVSDAMRTLAWAWVLIFIIVYMFAVLVTGSIGQGNGDEECEGAEGETIDSLFGSIYRSMFTLFSVMTINGWGELAKCAMQVHGWTWMIFVTFLLCTSYGMLNVVIAVIVEGVLERAIREQREAEKRFEVTKREAIAQIYELFWASDLDEDGSLTSHEFHESLKKKEVMRKLLAIGIDVRKAKNLFDILDYDGNGSLDTQEFLHGMMRARGEAKAKDVMAIQCDFKKMQNHSAEELVACKEQFLRKIDPLDDEIEAVHAEVRWLLGTLRDREQGVPPGGARSHGEEPPT